FTRIDSRKVHPRFKRPGSSTARHARNRRRDIPRSPIKGHGCVEILLNSSIHTICYPRRGNGSVVRATAIVGNKATALPKTTVGKWRVTEHCIRISAWYHDKYLAFHEMMHCADTADAHAMLILK